MGRVYQWEMSMIKFLTFMGIILLLGLGAFLAYLNLHEDKIGPEIVFEKTNFIYHEGNALNELLFGVSAVDDMDGDVTDSLMIVSLLPLTDKCRAKVEYVAKDSANNISLANLIVEYVPNGESTKGSIDTSKDTSKSGKVENKNTVKGARDKVVTAKDYITPIVTKEPNSDEISYPYIKLKTKEITVKKYKSFDLLSVIETLEDDKDDEETMWRRIQVSGNYHTNKVGSYELNYYATDTEFNKSNVETLTLNVIQ